MPNPMLPIERRKSVAVDVGGVIIGGDAPIAVHGIQFRDDEGNSDFVHLLFGSIAAVFFFMVLFQDVLEVIHF